MNSREKRKARRAVSSVLVIGQEFSGGVRRIPADRLGGVPAFSRFAGVPGRWAAARGEGRRADDGSRTRDLRLGKPTLYRLSYVRAGLGFYVQAPYFRAALQPSPRSGDATEMPLRAASRSRSAFTPPRRTGAGWDRDSSAGPDLESHRVTPPVMRLSASGTPSPLRRTCSETRAPPSRVNATRPVLRERTTARGAQASATGRWLDDADAEEEPRGPVSDGGSCGAAAPLSRTARGRWTAQARCE
jgi:hypothetical protein